jgi:galactose mutarotase-like enzyme
VPTTVTLTGERIRAEIVADEGARVQHLVDLESGRELLYQGKHPVPAPRPDFLDGCPGGWDTIFPNDAPSGDYPDHGLVWSTPFEVVAGDEHEAALRATLDSPSVEIEQRFSVLGGGRRGLRVDTRMRANEDTGPFFWCSHPMLNVADGWRVELPSGHARADTEVPGRFAAGEELGERRTIDVLPSGQEAFEVLFVEGASEASVAAPDGGPRTRVAWDDEFFRHLWIVGIANAVGIDHVVQLEPSTSHIYLLDAAVEKGTAVSLDGGSERAWWVEIESRDG